ncbi:MAG: ribosome maturation factor RimM [Alphaproteobacteria bacterium]|nr:ribosome maturation factor RimM [Alphaproteobacteria bacterium]
MAERVCLGAITGAHGVRGQVKVKPFTENPDDVGSYGPVTDEAGTRSFTIQVMGRAKDQVVVRLEGVGDRNAAEALRGTRLYVSRDMLPETEDGAFYHADLIGLRVEDTAGGTIGEVTARFDFGAGDLVEFRGRDGKSHMLPFTEEIVPVVDLPGGRIVIDPPEGSLD